MSETHQPRTDDAPITRLTTVEYFGVAGTYYEAAEKVVHQLAAELQIPTTNIIDAERGDQVVSLLALAMGPLDNVELIDPAVHALANAHGMRNIITPAIGFAQLLPAEHPVRIIFGKIHSNLESLFWPT